VKVVHRPDKAFGEAKHIFRAKKQRRPGMAAPLEAESRGEPLRRGQRFVVGDVGGAHRHGAHAAL
jgi:hypothetical protein